MMGVYSLSMSLMLTCQRVPVLQFSVVAELLVCHCTALVWMGHGLAWLSLVAASNAVGNHAGFR